MRSTYTITLLDGRTETLVAVKFKYTNEGKVVHFTTKETAPPRGEAFTVYVLSNILGFKKENDYVV